MPAIVDQVTRVITIKASAVGVDQTTASLNKLANAEENVTVNSDNVSKATLSMQNRLNSVQRSLDLNYRAQDSLAKVTRTLSGAKAQGLLDATEEARLLDLAKQKYSGLVPEVEKLTTGYKLNRMQMMELTHSARSMFDMLISGQKPMRALEMESMRLAQVMGAGEGGIGGALAALAPLLVPVVAVLGGLTLGIAGMTHEIDKATGKNVTFMEVIKGTFQAAWDGVTHLFGPAVQKTGSLFGQLIDYLVPATKMAVNLFVGSWVLAFEDVSATMGALPKVLGDLTVQAANAALKGIEGLINGAIDQLDGFIQMAKDHLGPLGDSLSTIGHLDLGKGIANPFAGATGNLLSQYQRNAAGVTGTDYAGMAFNNIKKFALQDYANDNKPKPGKGGKSDPFNSAMTSIQDETRALQAQQAAIGLSTFQATKLEEVTKLQNAAMKDATGLTPARVAAINKEADAYATAKANLEALNMAYNTGKTAFTGFFSNLYSNLKGGQDFWSAFRDAAVSALDSILQKAIEVTASNAFDQLWSGGSSGGGIGGWISSLLGIGGSSGGLGALYANGGVQSGAGISAYSSQIVDRPTVFPFANGIGLMGEAGAEAIMPLKRGPNGVLGVQAANGNAANNNFTYAPVYQVQGGTSEDIAALKAQMKADQASFEQRVKKVINDPRRVRG